MNTVTRRPVLILDFGSQYTQLIVRRVRELGVYCELHPGSLSLQEIIALAPLAIILSGGPDSVTDAAAQTLTSGLFNLPCPILGICYGMQLMAKQLGGEIAKGKQGGEFGYARLRIVEETALFKGISDHAEADGAVALDVWMSHGDQVITLPTDFMVTARTETCPIAAIAHRTRHWYGLQFHPEVLHTKQGKRILAHFLFECAAAEVNWNTTRIIEEQIAALRAQVGEQEEVILGLSGGVDSSVAAVLLHTALGKRLTCVFVDTGLLRLQEAEEVKALFEHHFGMRLLMMDAKQQFFSALQGVSDPEQKRKIIGKTFIDVFEAVARTLPQVKWLAQGTIYSDVIESAATGTGKSQVIKSHHNVGGLPEKMQLRLLEPLRELFKDEVREVGMSLGLPRELVFRHPFPGPGLGVRILGEIKAEYTHILQQADAIFIAELHSANLYEQVSQAFVVFLPVKSVGVVGDCRSYAYVLSLRAVVTSDFMTAHSAHLPFEFLQRVANRIVNEVNGVSRVVYDISGKPPATIEWE